MVPRTAAEPSLIQPPPRSSVFGTVLIIAAVVVLSIVPFSLRPLPWAAAIAALLASAALLLRDVQAFHISFFTALLTSIPLLHPALRKWPFSLLIPIMLYLAVVLPSARLRSSLQWLRRGQSGSDVRLFVVLTAAVSGLALYAWRLLLKPDLSPHLAYVPDMPLWLFPLAGLGFSLGNAAMEEFVFRGVIMQAAEGAWGTGALPVVIQAWLFGALHYLRGFPNGGWGIAMTFVYGVLLGVIRYRSRGMLAPWIAHVCADLVIFAILAGIVLG